MEISSSSEKFENEYIGRNEYLKNELKSLGVEPKRKNQLNDKEEAQSTVTIGWLLSVCEYTVFHV